MKMPWTKRAEAAERAVEKADEQLADTRRQWADVLAVTGRAQQHRETNGWTDTVRTIFGGAR